MSQVQATADLSTTFPPSTISNSTFRPHRRSNAAHSPPALPATVCHSAEACYTHHLPATNGTLPLVHDHLTTQPTRSSQRRLTDIWQLPPPYIADRPIPAVAARAKQQALTPAAQPSLLPTAAATPYHTPAPAVLKPPCSRRRRRTHVLTPPPVGTCGNITHYYPNRVYTPHAAANPANYTPDHDPDKQ